MEALNLRNELIFTERASDEELAAYYSNNVSSLPEVVEDLRRIL